MKNMPHGGQNLACDGDLYLHLVLMAYRALDIAEAIVIASLGLASCPGTFNECFPQIFVAMCDFPRLDLPGTFFVSGF